MLSRRRYNSHAGHAWRNQNPPLYAVIEQNLVGKRPFGRPRKRCKDVIKRM